MRLVLLAMSALCAAGATTAEDAILEMVSLSDPDRIVPFPIA